MRKFCALLKNSTADIVRSEALAAFFLLTIIAGLVFIPHAKADSWENSSIRNIIESPSFFDQTIRLYQKILSRSDGDRCPMYPSCSAYAKQAFNTHGPVKGWILTSDRLLRCGHDEIELSGQKQINGKYLTPDPLDKNDFLYK